MKHEEMLTDEQIVKALEYCCGDTFGEGEECEECSETMCYQVGLPEDREGGTRWCRQWLMKDALDLINRQKAENDELQRKIVSCNSEIESLKQTAEELDKANLQLMAILQTAQSEARKELAGKLKEASYIPNMSLTGEYVVDVSDIDNLLKEMDGEQNDR